MKRKASPHRKQQMMLDSNTEVKKVLKYGILLKITSKYTAALYKKQTSENQPWLQHKYPLCILRAMDRERPCLSAPPNSGHWHLQPCHLSLSSWDQHQTAAA